VRDDADQDITVIVARRVNLGSSSNGAVNPVDVGLVQGAFCSAGQCADDDLCQYDIDCNGAINPVDASLLQSLFGTCDPPRTSCD
jgi:hypothetical protein